MNNSMERIVPLQLSEAALGYETLKLHLERYEYAGKHVLPGDLMDVACGVGYGSFYLAENYSSHLESIVAADIDEASIQHARKNYAHPKITFTISDAMTARIGQNVKTIISLETIEHLENPELFIKHVSAQLGSGTRFIASVPITPSMDANPFHLHDFSKKRFINEFIKNGFREVDSLLQIQPFNPFKVLGKSSGSVDHLRKSIFTFYLKHPKNLLKRIHSTLRYGFVNRYYTGVFEKL